MNKFKVGNRVKVIGGFGPAKGTEGVVVEVDTGSALDSVLCRFKNLMDIMGTDARKEVKTMIRKIIGICIQIRLN